MRDGAITILILAAGQMQLPAIRIAKKRGWNVIVADANPNAVGIPLADRFEHVDLKDREGMTEMARRYRSAGLLDGVFTAGTDFSTTVAWVAEKCGLPGIPYSAACDATDKQRMRARFKTAGVACPDFVGLGADDDPEIALATLSFPLVVKPVDSMGARGVRMVGDTSELLDAVPRALNASRTSRAIVETYMDGPELSLDAVVYRSRVTICGIADRHICFPPYFVEMGHTMPSVLPKDRLSEAVDIFRRGIAALGITDGAAKGDIKMTSAGPMVGEIAARLSGGYMSGWTYPYSSGVDVTGAALNIAVGLPPGDLEPVQRNTSAERAFVSIPGRVKEIGGIADARRAANIRDVFLRVQPDQDVTFPANNIEKCGNVISQSPSREEAIRSADEAVRAVTIRLTADNPATSAFLMAFSDEDYLNNQYAFQLRRAENVEALQSMSPLWEVDAFRDARIAHAADVRVHTLPRIADEDDTDWHGMAFPMAVEKVLAVTQSELCARPEPDHLVLGSFFWRWFLKGGIQGGIYLIDTARKLMAENRSLAEILGREGAPC